MNVIVPFLCAISFFCEENKFYGWKMFPATPDEVICDGIVLLLLAIAFK